MENNWSVIITANKLLFANFCGFLYLVGLKIEVLFCMLPQPALTCSNLAIETLEKEVKNVQN